MGELFSKGTGVGLIARRLPTHLHPITHDTVHGVQSTPDLPVPKSWCSKDLSGPAGPPPQWPFPALSRVARQASSSSFLCARQPPASRRPALQEQPWEEPCAHALPWLAFRINGLILHQRFQWLKVRASKLSLGPRSCHLCICSLSPRRGARSLLSLSFQTPRGGSPASPIDPFPLATEGLSPPALDRHLPRTGPLGLAAGT